MTNQTDKRRGGYYWIDGRPYVSVTQVLKVIAKPAITYWFGQQVYYAVVKDPTVEEKEALAAPYRTSKKAKERGTDVHAFVEFYRLGAKIPEGFEADDEYAGYKNAFVAFTNTHEVEVLESEKTVVNHEERYAGTLDLIVNLGGEKVLIDVKTNKDATVYDEVGLQLSAYRAALGEDIPMYALALGANGNYTLKQMEYVYEEFLAAKKLWEWQNAKKNIAVGYNLQKGLINESNDQVNS